MYLFLFCMMSAGGDQLVLCSLSMLVGIFISHWYITVTLPEEISTADGSLTLIKSSTLVKILNKKYSNLGTIDLGDSASSVLLSRYDGKCISVQWDVKKSFDPNNCTPRKVRHVFSAGHWYGGPQYSTARWPIDKEDIECQPYLSDDLIVSPAMFGSILERYWLSSNGVAVYVPGDEVDFEYGMENSEVVFQASSLLSYVICYNGTSAKDTHMYMVEKFLHQPSGLPDKAMFQYPVWSTWARYKIFINESVVLQFSEEINNHGFPASQIEIDDTYTTNYGDHEFDSDRFPNPQRMISQLHSSGLRVTSWVHPFVNFDTEAFQEGTTKRYLLSSSKRGVPGLIKWWQGVGAMINMSDPDAAKWFVTKLEKLRDLGIDSFKFDAGEACYMPSDMDQNPSLETKQYVEVVAQFGGMIETRAAYRNQRSPTFLRMMDKHSYWGFDNGLRTMIPSALHLSIIGYHFILPDMIGGNAMSSGEDWYHGNLPEKELYIRWFQLVTFLQSMQISISPWQYDAETTEIARGLVKLHAEYVAPLVMSLAEETVKTGAPVIRPVWWVAPEEQTAYQVEDQFLIGDDVLVAPVVEKGVRSRFIYIPPGSWKEPATSQSQVFTGPKWINYSVTLRSIPYFERT